MHTCQRREEVENASGAVVIGPTQRCAMEPGILQGNVGPVAQEQLDHGQAAVVVSVGVSACSVRRSCRERMQDGTSQLIESRHFLVDIGAKLQQVFGCIHADVQAGEIQRLAQPVRSRSLAPKAIFVGICETASV